jgi:hypothetical protein
VLAVSHLCDHTQLFFHKHARKQLFREQNLECLLQSMYKEEAATNNQVQALFEIAKIGIKKQAQRQAYFDSFSFLSCSCPDPDAV